MTARRCSLALQGAWHHGRPRSGFCVVGRSASSPRLVRTIVPVLPTRRRPPAAAATISMSGIGSFGRIVAAAFRRVRAQCGAACRRRQVRQARHEFVAKNRRRFFDEAHFATYIHGGRLDMCAAGQIAAERGAARRGQGHAADPRLLPRRNAAMITRVSRSTLDLSRLLVALASLVAPAAAQSFSTPRRPPQQVSAAAAVAAERHQQPDRKGPLARSLRPLGRGPLALRRGPPRASERRRPHRPLRPGPAPLQPRTTLRRPQLPRLGHHAQFARRRSICTATCSRRSAPTTTPRRRGRTSSSAARRASTSRSATRSSSPPTAFGPTPTRSNSSARACGSSPLATRSPRGPTR